MVEEPPQEPYIGSSIYFCDNGASVVLTYLELHKM